MFRRVREAAHRGARRVKSSLASAGVAATRVGIRLGLIAYGGVKLIGRGLRLLARGVSWSWMTIIEVYAITDSPFIYVIGNVLWWVLRVGETVINKIRRTEYTWAHDHFPTFTLLNSVAIINLGMYPFVFVGAWLLSPIAGRNWFRNLMHGYKVRLLSAADNAYYDRFARDVNFKDTMGYADVWEDATAQQEETPESIANWYIGTGRIQIHPDPNNPEHPFQYMEERLEASGMASDDEFWASWDTDEWDRQWSLPLPPGVSAAPPAPAKHVAEDKLFVEPETPAEPEVDEHGLANYSVDEVTDAWATSDDTKERSFAYGVKVVREAVAADKTFLTNENTQNKLRAMVFNDTKNPRTGFAHAYAVKGFDAALAKEQAALV